MSRNAIETFGMLGGLTSTFFGLCALLALELDDFGWLELTDAGRLKTEESLLYSMVALSFSSILVAASRS